jgi:Mitochondrial carrier protein
MMCRPSLPLCLSVPALTSVSASVSCATASVGSAAAAGSVASALTNPLDLAKVRLQVEVTGRSNDTGSTSNGSGGSKRTLLSMLRHVYRHEGLRGLWRGSLARVLFHTPSTAITMALFERFKEFWNQQLHHV